MARRVADLVVITGTYIKDGEEKKSYQKIGVTIEDANGNRYHLIKKWFNPAGVPVTVEGSDAITVSEYPIEAKPAKKPKYDPPLSDLDDDIPF